jgi:tetratricopeptide (TPR) repeat protein
MNQSVDHKTNGHKLLSEGEKIPALREFQRAAELEKSSVGKNHLEYADLKVLIAELQAEKSDYEKAIDAYKIALLIFQSAFGRRHPRTAAVFGKMDAL